MVDSGDTESAIGDADDTPDEQTGGDSSKSNSVTSEHSLHSVGVSASSQSSSTNSLPAGGGEMQIGISRRPGSNHAGKNETIQVICYFPLAKFVTCVG